MAKPFVYKGYKDITQTQINNEVKSKMKKKFDYTISSPVKIGNAEEEKTIWINLGVAFKNDDGSISCNLNALPVNGKIVLFKPTPKEKKSED